MVKSCFQNDMANLHKETHYISILYAYNFEYHYTFGNCEPAKYTPPNGKRNEMKNSYSELFGCCWCVLNFNPNRVFQLIIWFNHLFTYFFRVCAWKKNYSKNLSLLLINVLKFLKTIGSLLWIPNVRRKKRSNHMKHCNMYAPSQNGCNRLSQMSINATL